MPCVYGVDLMGRRSKRNLRERCGRVGNPLHIRVVVNSSKENRRVP